MTTLGFSAAIATEEKNKIEISNYPNPADSFTRISYDLPEDQRVRLDVFDIDGKMIETLVDAVQSAGEHQIDWQTAELPAGSYLYILDLGGKLISNKCLIVR